MSTAFKLRVKISYGGVPKGYEFNHVDSQHYPRPTPSEVKETLIKLGFKNAKDSYWGEDKIEVIKRG